MIYTQVVQSKVGLDMGLLQSKLDNYNRGAGRGLTIAQ